MTAKRIAVKISLPIEQKSWVERVAKLAGVRPETVIQVLLALESDRIKSLPNPGAVP